jgi:hypothetical protein
VRVITVSEKGSSSKKSHHPHKPLLFHISLLLISSISSSKFKKAEIDQYEIAKI